MCFLVRYHTLPYCIVSTLRASRVGSGKATGKRTRDSFDLRNPFQCSRETPRPLPPFPPQWRPPALWPGQGLLLQRAYFPFYFSLFFDADCEHPSCQLCCSFVGLLFLDSVRYTNKQVIPYDSLIPNKSIGLLRFLLVRIPRVSPQVTTFGLQADPAEIRPSHSLAAVNTTPTSSPPIVCGIALTAQCRTQSSHSLSWASSLLSATPARPYPSSTTKISTLIYRVAIGDTFSRVDC